MTEECLGGLRADATIRKLVIVIHGFTKAFDTEWMHEMQRDIMRLDPGTAVVVRSKCTTTRRLARGANGALARKPHMP